MTDELTRERRKKRILLKDLLSNKYHQRSVKDKKKYSKPKHKEWLTDE